MQGNRRRDGTSVKRTASRTWAGVVLFAATVIASTAQPQTAFTPLIPPGHYAPSTPDKAVPPPLPQVALRSDQIALLEHALDQADTQGLLREDYSPAAADTMLRSTSPDTRRAGNDLLVAAVLRYARAVHSGRLAAADFDSQWGLHPADYDPTADFVQAVSSDRLQPWLDNLPPPYSGYDALKGALVAYRAIATRGGWIELVDGPPLKLGMTDPRVAALRQRLAVEDATVDAAGGPIFDQGLADAVARAQRRYGQNPDGVLAHATLAALNVPIDDRIAQIVANMERWRWLPAALPADRIQVNIAAAVLTLFKNDAPLLSMKAVTGRPGDDTPMLQSQISSVVLNPPWYVPAAIAAKELWPKERANPGYFARNDFVVVPMGDTTRLVQKAGPKAALGHVKFDFVNKYGVYLHDTPTHGTFAKYTRQDSHGCVRLEKPVVLAKALFADDPQWTPQMIDDTIAGGDTVRAPLQKSIAVFLLYWTAFVGADGAANFRADPYGWDALLMQRIAAARHGSA
jgi:murein L,D-transpeptidase YcbB/YkuD